MDEAWDQFVMVCQQALGELIEGRPEPFKALWSHADDVVIMGAFGGRPQPRTLRCTQAYRREVGQWKVVLRHADELPRKDEQQK
jgi:hypothetical protein